MLVHRTALAFVLGTAVLSGCARSIPVKGYDEAAPPPTPSAPVVLEVENHNWANVVLYVVHDGVQTRFTQVAAAHNASIEIPEATPGADGCHSNRGAPHWWHRQLRLPGDFASRQFRRPLHDREQSQPLQRRSLVEYRLARRRRMVPAAATDDVAGSASNQESSDDDRSSQKKAAWRRCSALLDGVEVARRQ